MVWDGGLSSNWLGKPIDSSFLMDTVLVPSNTLLDQTLPSLSSTIFYNDWDILTQILDRILSLLLPAQSVLARSWFL